MVRSQHRDLLKIRISGLSNGLHEYHFSSDPSDIGLGSNFTAPVEVNAALDKSSRQMYLKASVQTSGLFACDRCVEEFEQLLEGSYSMLYVYNEYELGNREPAEVQVINPDAVYIDLTEDVRQMTLLSVPLKLLCKEDCKGLCPQCGTNKNIRTCACSEDHADPHRERDIRIIEQMNKESSHAKP